MPVVVTAENVVISSGIARATIQVWPDTDKAFRPEPPQPNDLHRQGTGGPALILVIAGVAGSGKTTIGRMVAERWGVPNAEADDFHPEANRRKMAEGQPLSEEDRRPWLDAIAGWIDARIAAGESGVVTCSALKLAHRQRLSRPQVRFVFLKVDPRVAKARLAQRLGHFFPKELADSQFAALEEPGPREEVLVVDADPAPDRVVSHIFKTYGVP